MDILRISLDLRALSFHLLETMITKSIMGILKQLKRKKIFMALHSKNSLPHSLRIHKTLSLKLYERPLWKEGIINLNQME